MATYDITNIKTDSFVIEAEFTGDSSRNLTIIVFGLDDGITKWVHSGAISLWEEQGGYEKVTDLTPNSEYKIEFLVDGKSDKILYRTTRPSYFYWKNSSTSLVQGEKISQYITAEKWEELQDNVNEVRAYKGFDSYYFTSVYSGKVIEASDYNDLAEAINEMLSSNRISNVSKGSTITAARMMKLQNSINSI